ncbi:MAG TPA: hypothetical protein VII03_04200, partial [Solirubrobacteraceae bacterium]
YDVAANGKSSSVTMSLEAALAGFGAEASDPDYLVVGSDEDVRRLGNEILGERDLPIIGVTLRDGTHEPVLRASDIRSVVGDQVRICLLADDELLLALREILGARLRLDAGTLRIWWPGASIRCDPSDHPVVVGLEDEDYLDTLEEFAHEYDLSRPRVRSQVRVIEDARAFLEHEILRVQEYNRRVHERLRDAQIECHRLRTRAELAEARAAALGEPAQHD